jgi:hypothetical protein
MPNPYAIAVIPARDRHALLHDCLQSVCTQVDHVIVVDNESQPPIISTELPWNVSVVSVPADPPNISVLWNVGLRLADSIALQNFATCWDIAVLNSDVVIPPHWIATLSGAMRSTPAVLAYPDQHAGKAKILHTRATPVDLRHRITGFAYMLRGEAGLRLDERMQWWFSDDDLDWTARQQGGALLVPGIPVEHREPNISTNARPELYEQTGRDREFFEQKWGQLPW